MFIQEVKTGEGVRLPQFRLYEKVKLCTSESPNVHVHGERGTVLSNTWTAEQGWLYSVYVYTEPQPYTCNEAELNSLGEVERLDLLFEGQRGSS